SGSKPVPGPKRRGCSVLRISSEKPMAVTASVSLGSRLVLSLDDITRGVAAGTGSPDGTVGLLVSGLLLALSPAEGRITRTTTSTPMPTTPSPRPRIRTAGPPDFFLSGACTSSARRGEAAPGFLGVSASAPACGSSATKRY